MGIVDTVMVGPLGPAAIGAVGTGSTMFFASMVLGMGTLFALDTFVSQSFGAGRIDDCHRWLFAGLQLAVGAVGRAGGARPGRRRRCCRTRAFIPTCCVLLQPYLRTLLWSVPPLLVLYRVPALSAGDERRPARVHRGRGRESRERGGQLGARLRPCGTAGARGASDRRMRRWRRASISRRSASGRDLVARAATAVRVCTTCRSRSTPRACGALARLGVPAALQIVLEVGVFARGVGAGRRGSRRWRSRRNQIVLNIASFFFMVPLGLSSAAAVRVGQAVGRGDPAGARRAGWCGAGAWDRRSRRSASAIFVVDAGAVPADLHDGCGRDRARRPSLLLVVRRLSAVRRVSDRGDRRAARARQTHARRWRVNLVGHWFIGLPLAYVLCFRRGWGVEGLWTGLTLGLDR